MESHDRSRAFAVLSSRSVRAALTAALTLGFPLVARATPPEPGSAQAQEMAPYSDWIRGLRSPNTGGSCCDSSDCRVVEWRIRDGHYEAFITRQTWDGAPDRWVVVPDEVILPPQKRGPIAIACWAKWHWPTEGFFCFAPAPES